MEAKRQRKTAREIFLESLRLVDLRAVLRRKLVCSGSRLRVGAQAYDVAHFSRVVVLAVGKAAVPMAEGLLEAIGPMLRHDAVLEGLVVGTTLPALPHPGLRYRLGSHPLPDGASFEAAELSIELLSRCDRETLVFFLISGGSSAMLDLPLDPTISRHALAEFHAALVHSGLPIAEMNALRKHVSAVKGGRLAVAAGEATQCTLLVSDVPLEFPEIIGSGPSLPDDSTVEDCRELLQDRLAKTPLPPALRSYLLQAHCPETPKPDHPAFRRASWHVLLSSHDLCAAAATAAAELGFDTLIDLGCDEWDYRDAAGYLLTRLRGLPRDRAQCLISAGELAVPIAGAHGVGGRNQQFALVCAQLLQKEDGEIVVLSAGSDGADGNSPAAGAVIDGTTSARAHANGFSLAEALSAFDAFPLLHALGDTVVTGPSANNLRDLRLLLRFPA